MGAVDMARQGWSSSGEWRWRDCICYSPCYQKELPRSNLRKVFSGLWFEGLYSVTVGRTQRQEWGWLVTLHQPSVNWEWTRSTNDLETLKTHPSVPPSGKDPPLTTFSWSCVGDISPSRQEGKCTQSRGKRTRTEKRIRKHGSRDKGAREAI